jgi:hypothetical protein
MDKVRKPFSHHEIHEIHEIVENFIGLQTSLFGLCEKCSIGTSFFVCFVYFVVSHSDSELKRHVVARGSLPMFQPGILDSRQPNPA